MHANLLHDYRPTSSTGISLAYSLAPFFTAKISKLGLSLASKPTRHLHTYLLLQHILFSPLSPPATQSEIYNILSNCPNKQSDSECIPA